jgi:hypothetical protein
LGDIFFSGLGKEKEKGGRMVVVEGDEDTVLRRCSETQKTSQEQEVIEAKPRSKKDYARRQEARQKDKAEINDGGSKPIRVRSILSWQL